MGQVSDAVKGASHPATSGNLQQQVRALADEVSRLTALKDEDSLSEGAAAKSENVRKAGLLRAAHSLLRATERVLEDY